MKRLSICLLLLAFFPALALAQDKGPEVIKFTPKFGTVTFNHQAHQAIASDCAACHHRTEKMNCHECHGKGVEIEGKKAKKFKDSAHKLCAGCHDQYAEKGQKSGPGTKSCKECHIKQ